MHTQTAVNSFQPWKYSGEKLPEANPVLSPTGHRNTAYDMPLRKSKAAEFVKITPELAKHWLTFNTSNRNLRRKKLEKYVNLLLEGKFKTNGESIKFSYGKLIDGQHRLMAVVISGVSINALTVWGLDSGVQDTVDTGMARSAADVLGIEGLGGWEAQTLGTAAHAMINYSKGGLPATEKYYDNAEVKSFFLEHAVPIEATIKFMAGLIRRPALAPYSTAVAFHYIFAKKAREDADRFFEKLIDGDNLSVTSPIYHLRQRLINDLTMKRRRTKYQTAHMFVAAWNGYRRGSVWKGATALTLHEGAPFPEAQ